MKTLEEKSFKAVDVEQVTGQIPYSHKVVLFQDAQEEKERATSLWQKWCYKLIDDYEDKLQAKEKEIEGLSARLSDAMFVLTDEQLNTLMWGKEDRPKIVRSTIVPDDTFVKSLNPTPTKKE